MPQDRDGGALLPPGDSSPEPHQVFTDLRSFLRVVAQTYQNGEWTPDHVIPVQHALLGEGQPPAPDPESAIALPSANLPEDIQTRTILSQGAEQVLDIAATILTWVRITASEPEDSDRLIGEYYDIPVHLIQIALNQEDITDENSKSLLKYFIDLAKTHRDTIVAMEGTMRDIERETYDDLLNIVHNIAVGMLHVDIPYDAIAIAFRSLDGDFGTDSEGSFVPNQPPSPMGNPEGAVPPTKPKDGSEGAKVKEPAGAGTSRRKP